MYYREQSAQHVENSEIERERERERNEKVVKPVRRLLKFL